MTDVALKEHLERRIQDLEVRLLDRLHAAEIAVEKAERTMNQRLQGMNEFRDALKDQTARMATRIELTKLDEAVQVLERAKANLDGRLYIFSAGVSVLVSLLLWALTRIFQP